MKFTIKIPSSSKKVFGVKPSAGPGFWTSNSYGWGQVSKMNNENCFIGVHFEKVRRKVKQTKLSSGKTKSTIICDAHWIVTTYQIPFELLKLTGKKFRQHSRHFTIK